MLAGVSRCISVCRVWGRVPCASGNMVWEACQSHGMGSVTTAMQPHHTASLNKSVLLTVWQRVL